MLRAYLTATYAVPLLAKRHLRKRVARGKEHSRRWTEKLGQPSLARPHGTLIWLHAVGLGEVLSLRGLIHQMATQSDAHFLVTSSTRAGAEAFAQNAPPRTMHQFLPLDAPRYRRAFLDHWKPDLCVWVEQDIWPGFVVETVKRGIPQALIAARMNAQSTARHDRARHIFTHVYNQMQIITAQDSTTAAHLTSLGAIDVSVTGSLKPSAPALDCDAAELQTLSRQLKDRFVWITAPAHDADITLALAAHDIILRADPDALLIIAPRFPEKPVVITRPYTTRSKGEMPGKSVWLADTLGELGLMYRLSQAALIGGTNDDTEGHNPWESVALNTAIFHGPRTANFKSDYTDLDTAGATQITDAAHLAHHLRRDLAPAIKAATQLRDTKMQATRDLGQTLMNLIT